MLELGAAVLVAFDGNGCLLLVVGSVCCSFGVAVIAATWMLLWCCTHQRRSERYWLTARGPYREQLRGPVAAPALPGQRQAWSIRLGCCPGCPREGEIQRMTWPAARHGP